jgi:Tfp pilus assembly protein PilV
MIELIKNRISSKKGESLAEVLIGVLIIAVALLLLSSMIMSASKLVDTGQKEMKEFYNGISNLDQKNSNTEIGNTVVTVTYSDGFKNRNINITTYKDKATGLKVYEKKV